MQSDSADFFSAGRELMDRSKLPPGQVRRQFNAPEITKILLDDMLAQVAIVPAQTDQIELFSAGGDEEMLDALQCTLNHGTLHLHGKVPYKTTSRRRGPSIATPAGDMSTARPTTTSRSDDNTTISTNGNVVDLDRGIQLIVRMPETIHLEVRGLVGCMAITDDLDATVDIQSSIRTDLFARRVRKLRFDTKSTGQLTVGSVTDDATLSIFGHSDCEIGSIGGDIAVSIHGVGTVTINDGISKSLECTCLGTVNVHHNGTIAGNARVNLVGRGDVVLREVQGRVSVSSLGLGTIQVNGHEYGLAY